MWIATPIGFFSVVLESGSNDVHVRTWVRSDLERLKARYLPELSEIEEKGTGYPYLARASRAAFALALGRMAEAIDYPDFEALIAGAQGPSRQRAYQRVFESLQADLIPVDREERASRPDPLARSPGEDAPSSLEEKPSETGSASQETPFDYGPVLEVAVEAAREAAALLVEEFYRSGGPTGPRGSCPVDEAAEVAIRARLRGRFPDWQFYGEETGATGEASLHHWLIDPNDGTSAFQQGHRGAAVSIGLLRETTPVLGVVLAPCPPTGDEDLITWAEGCGPVRRNGAPVRAAPGSWADTLDSYTVVLVSQAADRRSSVNAELVAPARFLPVPSIAYRMALVAAGEGEVGVAVSGAEDFDYAGAHALLLGAGGVLLDADGQPVSYAPEGGRRRSGRGALFGGSPKLAAELALRDWERVGRGRSEEPAPFVWPASSHIAPRDRPLDRAQGILLGQLVGDALGAQVEFQTPASISHRFPQGVQDIRNGGPFNTLAGQPTDDSELALALARSLVERGSYDLEAVARAYVGWLESGPFDVGNTIGTALRAGRGRTGSIVEVVERAANPMSQANGALMRIAPLPLLYYRSDDGGASLARLDARLTHPHPVCGAANAAFVAAIASALRASPSPQSMLEAARSAIQGTEGAEPVLGRLASAEEAAPELAGAQQGWVLHAVQNAFFELLHARSFEEGLMRTVGRGGDTDTNGAIAGALLGALHGAANIPRRWVRTVLTCRPLKGRAKNPRPPAFWPVDALHIAERLLVMADTSEARP